MRSLSLSPELRLWTLPRTGPAFNGHKSQPGRPWAGLGPLTGAQAIVEEALRAPGGAAQLGAAPLPGAGPAARDLGSSLHFSRPRTEDAMTAIGTKWSFRKVRCLVAIGWNVDLSKPYSTSSIKLLGTRSFGRDYFVFERRSWKTSRRMAIPVRSTAIGTPMITAAMTTSGTIS
jgi:hypothetical protein